MVLCAQLVSLESLLTFKATEVHALQLSVIKRLILSDVRIGLYMYKIIHVDVSSEDIVLVNSLLAESDLTCYNHRICSGCRVLHYGHLPMQASHMNTC